MKNGGDVVTVGQNVARLRKEARLSQRELAEAMQSAGFQWHQTTVSRVESDRQKLTIDEAAALNEILNGNVFAGTDLARLVAGTELAGLVARDVGEPTRADPDALLRLKRLEASLLVCLEDVRDLLSAKVEDR